MTAEDAERLRTWALDVAAVLLPGVQWRDEGNERRFLGNGGLMVSRSSGAWYSHSAGHGGYLTLSLIQHLRPDGSRDDAIKWASAFLAEHPGDGSCTGNPDDDDGEAAAAASRLAAELALQEMVPVEGTPAERYLLGRGLAPPWPGCLGYWPNARIGEGALVGVLTAHSRTVGVQVGYLADGNKSLALPQRRRFGLEKSPGAVFVVRSEGDGPLYITEGLEDGIAVTMATAGRIWGVPGVGNLADLEIAKGVEVVVVRDGDEPGSPADKALIRGVDHLLLSGATVRVTAATQGQDANDILQSGGVAALQALITEAIPRDLSLDGQVQKLSRMASSVDYVKAVRAVAKEQQLPLGLLNGLVRDARKLPTRVADRLIQLSSEAEFFRAPDGTAYADFEVNGHRETWAVRSRGFKLWLSRRYFEVTRGAPNSEAMQAALAIVESKALFDAPERKVFIRVGGLGGTIYLDLCDEMWRAIEIDATGWRIVAEPLIRFRRAKGMLPLPVPVPGGDITTLRGFLNVRTDADFVLAVAFLLSALRDRGPYPILDVTGEQGAAKTTFSRMMRALMDPHTVPLRAPPREDRDIFIAAANSWLLGFDNVSSLPVWLSDTLCQFATGGGFATRQLYADAEETLFEATRPVILNGIEDFVTRADLADRSIFLSLDPISAEKRRPEVEMWDAFEVERPRILGALLNAVSKGLERMPEMHLASLPRMADFAIWVTACEPAVWAPGTFGAAYSGNLDQAVLDAVDADPVADVVRTFMVGRPGRGDWSGTATDLLGVLSGQASDQVLRSRRWPSSSRALAGRLRRAATNLRAIGITVTFGREGHAMARTIKIFADRQVWETQAAPSAPSANSRNPSNDKALGGVTIQTQTQTVGQAAEPTVCMQTEPQTVGPVVEPTVCSTVCDNPLKSNATDGADGADGVPLTSLNGEEKTPIVKLSAKAGRGIAALIKAAREADPTRSVAALAKDLGQPVATVRRVLGEHPT